MNCAVELGALGIDPLKFLTTYDDVERSIWMQLVDRMVKKREILDQRLAAQIAEEVIKRIK